MKRFLALLLVLVMPLSVSAEVFFPSHEIILHHQENTASCWAHASVTLAETLSAKAGNPASFSVDHVIANTKTGGGSPALFWAYALNRRGLLNADLTPSNLRVLSHEEQNNADLLWVKTQIRRFGAVTAQIAYPELTGTTLYNPKPTPLNHQIVLIGYDDAYPAESFTPTPPTAGAFLVQNSHGTTANLGGLFWISYHDATLLTQVETATSLVLEQGVYTPQKQWLTHAISKTCLEETLPLTVPDGEELRSITLPHSKKGTNVTLTVGNQTLSWQQQEEGSYTAYITPVTGDLSVSLTLTHSEGELYRPQDTDGNLVLLYGFAPTDAPKEKILLSVATPCTVEFMGNTYPSYQMMGKKLLRLRDWADAQGKGVLWESGTVVLTDTQNPTPPPLSNAQAVAVISQSRVQGDIPTPLYFIDGYQYLLLH